MLTNAMKQWLVEKAGISTDATDAEFMKAWAVCLALPAGDAKHLSLDEMTTLTTDEKVKGANELSGKLDSILSGLTAIDKRLVAVESKGTGDASSEGESVDEADLVSLIKGLAERAGLQGEGKMKDAVAADDKAPGSKDVDTEPSYFEKLWSKAGSDGSPLDSMSGVRVKGAYEQYSTTKGAAVYPEGHYFSGKKVYEGEAGGKKRYIDEPSQLDTALAGAWAKWMLVRQMPGMKLNDHDTDLIQYTLRNNEFGGCIGGEFEGQNSTSIGVDNRKLTEMEVKTLLDDNTSGGLEIAPIAFDDQIILVPLLVGELFPKVNVRTITRGRRIEGASMGTVTISSGGADDTAIPLQSTGSFISAFDTTIFAANGAIEIGRDFLSDSPINVGSVVTAQYGQVLAQWLDEQIAIGDGTTEPEGVMNASGTTSIAFGGVAPTLGAYESMFFGVGKAYKQGAPTDRVVFCGTETSYQRARAIAVSGTDVRRISEYDYSSYKLIGHPFALNGAMANTQQFWVNLARYRMYRRQGITFHTEMGGKELVRANKILVTVRARFGGQLEDGSAAAVTTTAQA